MAEVTLKVDGMSCGHCVAAVTTGLQRVDGVQDASVDLEAGSAQVRYDEERAGVEALVNAVEEEGYTARAE